MTLPAGLGSNLASGETSKVNAARCQACNQVGLHAFYEAKSIPTQTCVLLESRQEAADYPVGDLLLGVCEVCGFIQNLRFREGLVDYSLTTEESQACSPRFGIFAASLADELVARYRLAGRNVLEVGCGKGDFLYLLAERGIWYGLGLDPGYLPRDRAGDRGVVEFQREMYGPHHVALTADLVVTRHLLEHIPNVLEFFVWLKESVERTDGAALFTEVPDARRVLEEVAFWDVYYEHCSYFTAGSLARTLRSAGMQLDWIRRGFDDQYLLAGTSPGGGGAPLDIEETPDEIADMAYRFRRRVGRSIEGWRHQVADVIDRGGRVALWGGGSKAVAFLSAIAMDQLIVVDINPHKQGKWLPGVAVEVESPLVLESVDPDLVIAMNPVYLGEIGSSLTRMGLSSKLVAVGDLQL